MKKFLKSAMLTIITLVILFLGGCNYFEYSLQDSKKSYNVNLVLIKNNNLISSKVITNREYGSSIPKITEFKNFSTLVNGYVVVDDNFYYDINFLNKVYFPFTMPNKETNIYAKVEELTNISYINYVDSNQILFYFNSNSSLKDEYSSAPDITKETSYYEISVHSVATITNYFRYYPAINTLMLIRGYSQNENIGGQVLVQDCFNSGISINFSNKVLKFTGIYTRNGYSSSTATSGTVNINFNINSLAIKGPIPYVPNFSTINYSYTFNNCTNYSKMRELWNATGYTYAEKCYSQFNTLLKSFNEQINIFINS